MLGDLSLLTIDKLLEMRNEIDGEIKVRAFAELEAIDERRKQLLQFVPTEKPQPVDELKERRTRKTGVAKFRNPANPDQTWTGRGKKPAWIGNAVDLTPFLIAA